MDKNILTSLEAFIITKEIFAISKLPNIEICKCIFNERNYKDTLFSEYNINLPLAIERSVIKRKAEFLAGRYAAQQALMQIGVDNYHVGIGQHRQPIWPNGILGSITHTANTAICAVAKTNSVSSIGIDLELYMKLATANNVKYSIVDHDEESLLHQILLPFERALTLTFSAKESLFKALYPFAQKYFDFDSVGMQQICLDNKQFVLSIQRDLAPDFLCGTTISGYYFTTSENVFTIIYLPADIITST